MPGFDGVAARLSMVEVISRVVDILGRNLVAFGSLASLVVLLIIAAQFMLGLSMTALYPGANHDLLAYPMAVIEMVLQTITAGAVTHIAVADLEGRRTSITAALATGLRLVVPLIGLAILFIIGVGLASLLILVPGVMLAMRWILATPVRVVEGPSIGQALSRSAALTRGSRWELFGLTVAFLIVSSVITYALGLIDPAMSGGMASLTALVAMDPMSEIGASITGIIGSIGVAVCYVDLCR